jgi:Protein of unknown function (DUF2934)
MKSKKEPPQSHPSTTLLRPRSEEDLRGEIQQVQLLIARRAYDLFVARGCRHGNDQEDWFRAEAELLRPISVSMSEQTTGSVFALTFQALKKVSSRSASSRVASQSSAKRR